MSTVRHATAALLLVLAACGDSPSTAPTAAPEATQTAVPAAASPAKPGTPVAAGTAAAAAATYVCPMHPEVTSKDPEAKCSKCGMDLVKKDDGKVKDSDHSGHQH